MRTGLAVRSQIVKRGDAEDAAIVVMATVVKEASATVDVNEAFVVVVVVVNEALIALVMTDEDECEEMGVFASGEHVLVWKL